MRGKKSENGSGRGKKKQHFGRSGGGGSCGGAPKASVPKGGALKGGGRHFL